MKKITKLDLHCGACFKSFNSIKLLSKHIKNCPEAKLFLPLIHILVFGGDKIGHPLSHFFCCIKKAVKQGIVKKYAYAVADDLNVLERAELHKELCDVLEIPYKEFRPFESSRITKIMSRKEALNYLCEEIKMFSFSVK